jgi:hypothetical protein
MSLKTAYNTGPAADVFQKGVLRIFQDRGFCKFLRVHFIVALFGNIYGYHR